MLTHNDQHPPYNNQLLISSLKQTWEKLDVKLDFRTPAVNSSTKRCLEMRSRLEWGVLLHDLVTHSFAIADVKCIAPMIFGNTINLKLSFFENAFFVKEDHELVSRCLFFNSSLQAGLGSIYLGFSTFPVIVANTKHVIILVVTVILGRG